MRIRIRIDSCPTLKRFLNKLLDEYDMEFVCPHCGAREDRDLHAARNMVWFKENIVGVERTEYQPVEFGKAIAAFFKFPLPDESQEQQEATNSLS